MRVLCQPRQNVVRKRLHFSEDPGRACVGRVALLPQSGVEVTVAEVRKVSLSVRGYLTGEHVKQTW